MGSDSVEWGVPNVAPATYLTANPNVWPGRRGVPHLPSLSWLIGILVPPGLPEDATVWTPLLECHGLGSWCWDAIVWT